MGMSVGCYTGWGFEWNKVTDEVLKSFFRNHKEVLDKCAGPEVVEFVLSDNFTNEDFEDINEYNCDAEYGYSNNNAMNLVANIITHETNIRISSVNQDGENDTIMFEPCYPWELTVEERNLTRESLTEMLKKYQTELGMEGEISTKYVEWWG